MKGGTLQINWHGSDPVLSLDFHRLSGLLATAGADHDIKLWSLSDVEDASMPSARFHSSLSYHTAAVNVVRFSAVGDQLASGADGGEILLWKLFDNPDRSSSWKLTKNLRFHVKDVLDLQWASDGASVASASVDNTVVIWDIVKGNPLQVLKDHIHYVQGIAWDPYGQYIASISSDRTCRIYCKRPTNLKAKLQDQNIFTAQSVLVKADSKQEEDACVKVASAKQNLFHDETLPSFFRRLAWAPDGSFLLVPSGIYKFPCDAILTNTAFIVSRKDLSRPAMQLPGASKPIVAVRFCPLVFSLHHNTDQRGEQNTDASSNFKLPYRLIFAVATLNSLYVYDTQCAHPLAMLAGIHYAAITDIAWSWDAKYLAVSSQDGFCTLVSFDHEELGCPMPENELPSYIAELLSKPRNSVDSLQIKSSQCGAKIENQGDEKKLRNVDMDNVVYDNVESVSRHGDVDHNHTDVDAKTMLLECTPVRDGSVSNLESTGDVTSKKSSTIPDKHENGISKAEPAKSRRITPIAVRTNSISIPSDASTA